MRNIDKLFIIKVADSSALLKRLGQVAGIAAPLAMSTGAGGLAGSLGGFTSGVLSSPKDDYTSKSEHISKRTGKGLLTGGGVGLGAGIGGLGGLALASRGFASPTVNVGDVITLPDDMDTDSLTKHLGKLLLYGGLGAGLGGITGGFAAHKLTSPGKKKDRSKD